MERITKMKRTRHKILSVFLSFCMIISCMVGMSVTAGALPATSGECGAEGNNVTWEYNSTSKTLTISGTGAMKDYNSAPDWSTYKQNIEKIVIDSGVTSIGNSAFSSCSSLTSVTIPNSVTSIGDSAFSSCSSLTSVTIPNSVTSIGDSAFSSCSSLTSVTIPEGVTSIGNTTFFNCSALTSVNIPSTVTSIGINTFRNCQALTSVTIPNSVTNIGNNAFMGCSALTSVDIPSGVISIGEATFSGCSKLTSVTIPDSVTSIGNDAFKSCSALTSVTIPGSVTSIGTAAFYGCSELTSVTILSGVTSIGNAAFNSCSKLTNVTIPGSVTSIGNGAFNSCSALTSVDIPSGVTSIGMNAFFGCSHLASVTIPSSMTSIDNGAFYNCSALASVTFERVSETDAIAGKTLAIGEDAFYDTVEGAKVAYGTGSTVLNDGTNDITTDTLLTATQKKTLTWKAPNAVAWTNGNVIAILDGTKLTVAKKSAEESGDMGTGWTAVGSAGEWSAVKGTITEVEIQDGVTSIGGDAFNDCSLLETVTIPSGVKSIGGLAFFKCGSLTSIAIPDSVTSIGGQAFRNCSTLANVTIPNSVISIGDSAFANCSTLASVTIPSSVTSIGHQAFDSCSSLATVTFEPRSAADIATDPALSIGMLAFSFIPEGAKVAYGLGVTFLYNGTTKIEANSALTGISDKNLTWKVDNNVKAWTNGDVIGVLEEEGNVKKLIVGKKAGAADGNMGDDGWTKVGSAPDWEGTYTNITEVEIKDGVTSIGVSAFNNCISLTSVTIPGGVTSIASAAFYNCGALTSVTIPSSVTSIESYAFFNCTSLTSVTIPSSVTSIGVSAFKNCSSLTSVTIPSGVTSIGMGAFDNCSSLTSVTIPGSVTSIGSVAFGGCSNLTSVIFIPGTADATLSIVEGAFAGTATGASLAYGAGNAVLYDGDTEIKAGTKLYEIGMKILKWKAKAVPDPEPDPDPDPEPDPEPEPEPEPEPNKYTLTFDFNGGGSAVYYIEAGEELADYIPEIGQEGYTFLGWDKLIPDTMPENDLTFKAMWKINQYTVTFNTDGGSAVESITLDYNEIITVPAAPTKEGYTFSGWYDLPARMPARDITVKAKWTKEPDIGPHPVIPANATPSQTTTTTTTTPSTTPTKVSITAEQTEDNSTGLSWDSVPDASSYSIYVKTADGYKLLQKTSKRAVDVIYTTSGKYYVSDGGSYTIYKYKNGSFVKVGTASESKAAKVTKANNVTVDFMVKYTKNGVLSTDEQSLKASQKIYYKPAVKLTAKKGSIVIKWADVPGAEKYRLFKLVNGKLRLVTETEKHNILISGTKAGKEYSYAVKALVDGKWTKVYTSDIVSVKAK